MTRQQNINAETAGNTLCLVKAKPFANALADRLSEIKAISVGETMTDVNCALQL